LLNGILVSIFAPNEKPAASFPARAQIVLVGFRNPVGLKPTNRQKLPAYRKSLATMPNLG
jgi:hypothetical protein